MIVGVDEVGRGSIAGPLCVAAVAWPERTRIKGLNDSKQLSRETRQKMAAAIRLKAHSIGIGWVSPQDIDTFGLSKALRRAALCAVSQISVPYDRIVVDGRDKLLGDLPADYIIKADTKIPAVMAASNIAKVARDMYMAAIATQFSQYEFARHVGYGTAMHRAMIAEHGPCMQHRMSFAPLKDYSP